MSTSSNAQPQLGGGETGTTSLQHFGRLTPTGCSTSFDPGANSSVHSLAVQLDRKIVVVGAFTTLGGGGTGTAPRRYLRRVLVGGSLDDWFNAGASRPFYTVAGQPAKNPGQRRCWQESGQRAATARWPAHSGRSIDAVSIRRRTPPFTTLAVKRHEGARLEIDSARAC